MELAKLESLDSGKPLDEAAWDIVSLYDVSFHTHTHTHIWHTLDFLF